MVIEAYIQSLHYFQDVRVLLAIFAGVVGGLIGGVIPGLGGMLMVTLLLPFLFGVPPQIGLALLVSIMSVQYIGGSITAILLGIPGTPPNAATVLDGFPMTQQGEGARALMAARMASITGSVVSVLLTLFIIPVVLPLIFLLYSAEIFLVILLGLTFLATLSKGSVIKGFISGALGLLMSFIGYQALTGLARFNFGSLYLYDGIPLIPLALGLFGMPVMIDLSVKETTIAKTKIQIANKWQGIIDVYDHKWLCLRSSLIGYLTGLIPGIGAMVGTFVSYGWAKTLSNNPEKFGEGTVEGVIAPESANDAKEAGALLTTCALGIPGSSTWAIIMGAMVMMGLKPGPDMLRNYLPLTLSLLMIIVFASILGGIISIMFTKYLVKVSTVSASLLVPILVPFLFVGSYVYRGYLIDILATLIFALLGLGISKFGYNAPALFLGFVLGYRFELEFFTALATTGRLFFLRPLSLLIILIIVISLTIVPIKTWVNKFRKKGKAI